MKQKIAVLFGGRSPEHDVSVVTALQVMNALDSQRYEVIPVYIATDGQWLTGEALRKREGYMPKVGVNGVISVTLDVGHHKKPRLIHVGHGLFGRTTYIEFDVALLSFHGLIGEDGGIQGLMELANVPYTGMRLLASSVFMDKVATKHLLTGLGVPVLPFAEIRRPAQGSYVAPAVVRELLGDLKAPYCVKPSHLGSSIGVGKANDADEVAALLPAIFTNDTVAIVEPFVPNMVEYNAAVTRLNGQTVISALERPKRVEELLDFKEKYLSGGGKKTGGTKAVGQSSEGMLSLTREINPVLAAEAQENIRSWACTAYDNVLGTGVPRIDFISDEKTGEIWLNEVNPCPGSFAYFLWEASRGNQILFSDLLDKLIAEAMACYQAAQLPADPVPEQARLLKR